MNIFRVVNYFRLVRFFMCGRWCLLVKKICGSFENYVCRSISDSVMVLRF